MACAAQEFGKSRLRLTEETIEHLILYAWPGKVRQLNNELRRVVAFADSDSTIAPSALSKEILRSTPRAPRGNVAPEISVALTEKLVPALARVERERIKAARARACTSSVSARACSAPPPIAHRSAVLKRPQAKRLVGSSLSTTPA